MTVSHRAPAKPAPTDLVVLRLAEEFCGWLLHRTVRWPKNVRFTLTQRLQNHALDCVELLVSARYQIAGRSDRLAEINLLLERMRYLLRLSKKAGACPSPTFESAVRKLDEIGRLLYGWRKTLPTGVAP